MAKKNEFSEYLKLNYPNAKGSTTAERAVSALEEMDEELGQQSHRVGSLQNQITDLKTQLGKARDQWIAEAQKNGANITTRLELEREQHRTELVKLIAEGKTAEAILYLLTPQQIVFGMDVRMDDSAHKAAMKEYYDKGVKDAIASLTTMIMPVVKTAVGGANAVATEQP